MRTAKTLADKHAGVIAWSREANPWWVNMAVDAGRRKDQTGIGNPYSTIFQYESLRITFPSRNV